MAIYVYFHGERKPSPYPIHHTVATVPATVSPHPVIHNTESPSRVICPLACTYRATQTNPGPLALVKVLLLYSHCS